MQHKMKLRSEEFDHIIYDNKIIEVRLNDKKRKGINPGDKITFYKLPELNEFINVLVKEKHIFSNFQELYNKFPPIYFGYEYFDINKTLSMIYSIYNPMQEKENGVVAIVFEVITKNK